MVRLSGRTNIYCMIFAFYTCTGCYHTAPQKSFFFFYNDSKLVVIYKVWYLHDLSHLFVQTLHLSKYWSFNQSGPHVLIHPSGKWIISCPPDDVCVIETWEETREHQGNHTNTQHGLLLLLLLRNKLLSGVHLDLCTTNAISHIFSAWKD